MLNLCKIGCVPLSTCTAHVQYRTLHPITDRHSSLEHSGVALVDGESVLVELVDEFAEVDRLVDGLVPDLELWAILEAELVELVLPRERGASDGELD